MQFVLLLALAGLYAFFSGSLNAAETSLAIVQAGVQQADDAPFVPADYRFLPGDYIFFTFEIAGFGIKTNEDGTSRRISLTYEVTPEDQHGTPLATPVSGGIAEELAPEDKNWTPKRRASFVLPSDIAAGDFRMHVAVKDLIAKTEADRDVPFRVGGTAITPSSTLTVERFQFFRSENDRKPVELPAYSRGDSVYIRFDLVGFQVGPHNQYHVSYGLTVLSPSGRVYLDQPKAAELEDRNFYPAQFVPAGFHVTTSNKSELGQYTILLKVHDLISHQNYETKQAFTLE